MDSGVAYICTKQKGCGDYSRLWPGYPYYVSLEMEDGHLIGFNLEYNAIGGYNSWGARRCISLRALNPTYPFSIRELCSTTDKKYSIRAVEYNFE